MTANEQQLFNAARGLIDLAVEVGDYMKDYPRELRQQASRALYDWDALRGDIGAKKAD